MNPLAVGAAVVAAEAFYFKTLHEEEQLHHHHLRRDYDLYYRRNLQGLGGEPAKVKSPKRVPATLPPKRYKPQSLRRTQRRNQRKNKNAGAQLENYKKLVAAKLAEENKRRRGKRQVTFQPLSIQFPTVAPRPYYSKPNGHWNNSPLHPPPRPFYPKKPPPTSTVENMFSLNFISNFLRRHSSPLMKYMPSIPWFGKYFQSTPKYPHYPNQKQYAVQGSEYHYQGFAQPPLNSRKNMISRSFSHEGEN